ncbi:MAG: restriction endonuclease [Desulfurococcales archaeon]|nr:restriction endonuclease [Desulfurococcales archaeon]
MSSRKEVLLQLLESLKKGEKCLPSSDPLAPLLRGFPSTYIGLGGDLCFSSLVPVALEALRAGSLPSTVASFLDWRDFEVFVTELLELSGFEVKRSIRMRSRRFEIDVFACDPVRGKGVAIDCKHWTPGYSKRSKLKGIAEEHRAKLRLFLGECETLYERFPTIRRCRFFVPAVVTLTESLRGFVRGSFVVPIASFRDFISRLDYYIETFGFDECAERNPCS